MKPEATKAFGDMASLADLVAKARAASHLGVSVGRPEGSITCKEYSELTGVSVSAAKRHLDSLVNERKYEMIEAVAPTTYGMKRVTKQMFYREVSNAMDRIR